MEISGRVRVRVDVEVEMEMDAKVEMDVGILHGERGLPFGLWRLASGVSVFR